ncbi:MAG TPA: anti-sigma factor [Solirubrobacteraceae bacterium]|nr:anti-sigma factor [Solirubrobacteraceae bacterium]
MNGASAPHIDPDGCPSKAAAYVLGALPQEELDEFERHMDSCVVCRDAVAGMQPVADALASSVTPLTSPADLRERVMSSVYGDARERTSSAHASAVRRWALAPLRWRSAVTVAAVAAAVTALLVIALTPATTSSRARVIRVEVTTTPRASAVLRVSGGHAELEVIGMPQSAPNRVYEVWIKRGGALLPTNALFTVTDRGSATVAVPGDVRGAMAVLVTSEPRGGSPAPTRTPVIVAPLS